MIISIGEILKDRLVGCNFVDRLAGVVQTVSIQERDAKEQKTIIKKYPAACDVESLNCGEDKSRLKDLMPDSKKRSVIYFEDIGGIRFLRKERNDVIMQARIRLVAWLNQQQLGKTDCSVAAPIMSHVIAKLVTTSPFNDAPFTKMMINVETILQKSPAIFSRYTYNEAEMQYLMYPFDYFAIDFVVNFAINANCIDDFVVNPADECNTH